MLVVFQTSVTWILKPLRSFDGYVLHSLSPGVCNSGFLHIIQMLINHNMWKKYALI